MNSKALSPIVLAALAIGCSKPPAPVSMQNNSVSPGKPRPGSAMMGPPPTPTAQHPSVSEIPAALKGDAYAYYGLGYEKPIDFEWTDSQVSGIHSGTQTFALQQFDPKKATFAVDRTGGLSDLGTETLELRPDGIFVVGSDKAKITGDRLELPNGLVKGKTWSNHQTLEYQSGVFDINLKWTVKGMGKFSTKAGTYDGLEIVATGSGAINSQKVQMSWDTWFVKDKGLLKYSLDITMPDKKVRKMSFQEAKS